MLDLTTWNLSVPTSPEPTTITTARLNNGYQSQYFRRHADGSVTFWVPVNGSHTADARYPRSELRETQADGALSNWYHHSADNYLSAVLSVNQLPSKNKIVIAQIHSKDEPGSDNDPLIKLQYHYLRGVGRLELLLRKRPGDAEVQNILLAENIQLNERFGYDLRITPSGKLGVSVHSSDGDKGALYRQLSGYWSKQQLYFKAGAYIQDNYGPATEGGRVTFYWLNSLHR
ncbi:polysaccharide lyase family 7 protein [Pseudomonas sp. UBA2684]|uniref:polysaccharide lyase family 7 protein n=1 Tax=Pseudomonas sp. UBA2684 TaxID=1947311 RepID=UPI000E9D5E8C|nr:polysaccharide lyase family 7 protein [Pseudomonas sp. UBA2684]HBX54448.1 polysaccharide lyase family 7 protein [Pseudomonas sp.]